MNSENHQPNIVVIGGGTGSFTLLSGLKRYTSNITALVNMSDGSDQSGVLWDELGVLPPGDVRQCLVALSDTEKVRDLFTYRFDEGSLDGHSFGNLFLSAVQKMTDSFEQAIEVASDVLRITGRVLPVTLDKVTVAAETPDGYKTTGQDKVSTAKFEGQKPELSITPAVTATSSVLQALKQADVIVIAPGNLYGTLAPALLVGDIGKALKKTKAKVVQVVNLVTKPGQTDNFTVSDYASEVERFAGVGPILDYVIFNTDEPTKQMRDKYVRGGEYMLEFDLDVLEGAHYRAIGLPLIDKSPITHDKNDKITHRRSLIRHDSDVVSREIMKIYFS
jgi:uncharacterized cofD-like protein